MRRERFLSILAFFHIANNASCVPYGAENHDPIYKIRPFVKHLNTIFKQVYQPEREVCIDEAMVPFKGRSRFKVYMKDKPTNFMPVGLLINDTEVSMARNPKRKPDARAYKKYTDEKLAEAITAVSSNSLTLRKAS
ncbi:PiggyBac transposable element-derived protein 4-like [Elysia marginata]|uniref:PiggyBac transposable element-derived protein 4-like n=1 Tax=Elysia marginata TaxID=1093978 RepID=A0AAV4EPG7_9GAST|nr:PiggyBac transposable element-derived protein 4-like [Elysia marginata]